ncbi:MAG: nicotinate phosphoribosyltransferase [Neisseriaceae bacterium]
MFCQPIIRSLLDTDLYKFTMLQTMLHRFPQTHSVYRFKCRNLKELPFPLGNIKAELECQLDYLCELKFQLEELDYLRQLRFIKEDFVDYLELFHLKRRFVHLWVDEKQQLNIEIEGPMIQAMFFETFLLALVSELYYRYLGVQEQITEGEKRLSAKISRLKQLESLQDNDNAFFISDFGTRRRFSAAWQEHVVERLVDSVPRLFRGTSNVFLAKKFKVQPIGTMAHEFLQAFQAINVRLRDFQKAALESWVQEYRGDLGIALTDVVGIDAFLRDFDLYFAKLFDGLRHDSGDAYEWGEKVYRHYKKLGINTKTKILTFSDELDIEKAWKLYQYFKDRFKTSFGIGTHLTNDMGFTPLNIVLKLVSCNGQAVAKLSDSPGKTMTVDPVFLDYLKKVFSK